MSTFLCALLVGLLQRARNVCFVAFCFCKCCSNTCPQEAFGSSTQPKFVRRQLAIAIAIGQSGHGIDSADADAAEDDDGYGDNDSDDDDKCFP